MIELEILEIGTFNEGTFRARVLGINEVVTCYLHNKERDWDKLYNYMTGIMKVRGSIMTQGNFLVMEIVD